MNRVTKTPCQNKNGWNRVVQDEKELSRRRSPPRRVVIIKDASNKRAGGGGAGQQRSPIHPVTQTPQRGQAYQTRWGDGEKLNQTNKPNQVMEHPPIKIPCSPVNATKMLSWLIKGSHQTAINPLKTSNTNKIDKLYFI